MRRADRLFQLVQILRRRRVVTAARLAERLEVSERTIYRDIRDLVRSGVPIQGEAGVGYALPRGFDLPPLMFTEDEVEALVLGARIVRSWGDPALGRAAQDVLDKVETVLPPRLKDRIDGSVLYAINFSPAPGVADALALLRRGIDERRKVQLAYVDARGDSSQRVVRPVCLAFVAPLWMLSAWCELRGDFRNFRLDRIDDLALLDERFVDEPGKTVQDFLRRIDAERTDR